VTSQSGSVGRGCASIAPKAMTSLGLVPASRVASATPRSMIRCRMWRTSARTVAVAAEVAGGPPCSGMTRSLRWLMAASTKSRRQSIGVAPSLSADARWRAPARRNGGSDGSAGRRGSGSAGTGCRSRHRHRRRWFPSGPAALRGGPPPLRRDTMTDDPTPPTTIPRDDLSRRLTVARPDQDQSLPHLGLVGDIYSILVTGDDAAGRYTLIDMHVPPGGGPPPHRHDFEEMFTILEGAVEVAFRGETLTARAGEPINVPANAPHGLRNIGATPSRLLCLCTPPARTSSSRSSVNPCGIGPTRRRPSTKRPRPPSSPRRNRSHRGTAPNCCHHPAASATRRMAAGAAVCLSQRGGPAPRRSGPGTL
jgi:quercetin dioxygenase-like cupin family protein